MLAVQQYLTYRNMPSSSEFDFVQASFANKVDTHKIIEKLIQGNTIEAFIEDVVDVEKRLNNGLVTEVRQLELELICASKVFLLFISFPSYSNWSSLLLNQKVHSTGFKTR